MQRWGALPRGAWLAVTASEDLIDQEAGDLGAYLAELRLVTMERRSFTYGRFQHRRRKSGERIHHYALIARRVT